MCAEFIYGRAKVKGLREELEKELFAHLGKPGWDEIGILLLAIHSEQTQNEGHLKVLGWLDTSNVSQAEFLVQAITGNELSFTDAERKAWLPLAIASCLVYPNRSFAKSLTRLDDKVRDHGIHLMSRLFTTRNDEQLWNILRDEIEKHPPPGVVLENDSLLSDLQHRWLTPPDDHDWPVLFNPTE